MRKVFLDELPKKMRAGKEIIDWKNSVGCKVPFVYDDVEGEVIIINRNKRVLTVKYNENNFEICDSHFANCNIGGIVGKYNSGKYKNENDLIINKTPWMIELGVSEEDAKKYTVNSKKKIEVTCPDCGIKKKIVIYSIYNYKSICCSCRDSTSYPEKIVINLLKQLNLNFEVQYSPKWAGRKRYDFYLPKYNIIIEVNGEQHYVEGRGKFKHISLYQEQENDRLKQELALKNKIEHYIVIDCRKSEINFIKNNILNSKLNNLFDLSKIDWNECEEFALSNLVKEICEYWNNKQEWETTKHLAKIIGISRSSVIRCLNKGNTIGWCLYDGDVEIKKALRNNAKLKGKLVEIFKDDKSLGIFKSCAELERKSEELFGIKLYGGNISLVCNGKSKHHKGFTFRYIEESDQQIAS